MGEDAHGKAGDAALDDGGTAAGQNEEVAVDVTEIVGEEQKEIVAPA